MFNGVITHHLSENPNLVYAILRSHKAFEDLGTFTLAGGLKEIRRIQKAKEEQAARNGTSLEKDTHTTQADGEELEKMERHGSTDEVIFSVPEDEEEHNRKPDSRADATVPDSESSPLPIRQSSETQPTPSGTSEKARGKMPERTRSASLDTTSSLERIATSGVGRNGFLPTQQWVSCIAIGFLY